ncbi:MAG: GntR family transcriptional regulator [Pseudomonadota bacterium]
MPSTPTEAGTNKIIHEHVFERVSQAIISGQFSPDSTISVRKLASEYGVSAMPAREAIRRLVAMGALEMTDTRRITLAKMSESKMSEIRVARLALEPFLAVKAWETVSTSARAKKRLVEQLVKHDADIDAAINSGDVSSYARSNSAFHFSLYRASEASVVLGLVESLWLQFGPFMRVVIGRLGTAWLKDDKHKDAVAALRNDDPALLESAITADISEGMDKISEADFQSV